MYRLYKTILPSGLLFFFSLFLSGTEVPELTLSDFITTACRKQPQFQQLLIRELEIKYQKVIDFPPGQLILSLLPEYSLKLGSTNKHTLSTTLSLARLFPVSGTEIKGIYTTSPAGGNQKSSFSIAVIQPLVHNAFGSLNRLDKKMTALEQKLVSFQILESYEDYLAVLMKLYYDWFTSHTALDQAAGAYQDNLELLKNIRAKARAGIANKADVAQTRIQVLASRENLLTASNTLQKVFNEIRSAAGKKADYQAGPVKKLPRLTKIKDTATAIEETEADSRTFKIIKLNRKTAALNAEKYQKELLPEINLEMSFIREGDDYFPKDGASEFNIGLNLNLALPDKTGRALKEQAGLRLKRTVLNNKTQIINFKNTLKNLYATIILHQKLLDSYAQKITLSRQVYDNKKTEYRQGRASLNDLIQAKNSYQKIKSDKLKTAAKLQSLIIEWLRLTDSLLQGENKITREKLPVEN